MRLTGVRKYDLLEPLEAKNKGMLIAFLYLDKEIHPYAAMEKAMKKAIHIRSGIKNN